MSRLFVSEPLPPGQTDLHGFGMNVADLWGSAGKTAGLSPTNFNHEAKPRPNFESAKTADGDGRADTFTVFAEGTQVFPTSYHVLPRRR